MEATRLSEDEQLMRGATAPLGIHWLGVWAALDRQQDPPRKTLLLYTPYQVLVG